MRVVYILIFFSCSDVEVPVPTTQAPTTASGMEYFVKAQNYKGRFGSLEIVHFENNYWNENEQETAVEKVFVREKL